MERAIGCFMIGVAVSLTMINCGGGGGDSGPNPIVTPPGQSLQGTYMLTGFQVDYSNGVTITDNSSSVISWSGTMQIGTSSISQSFMINNIPLSVSGSATITWVTTSVSGIAHVTDSSGTHDIAFTISGNDLSTYSGVVQSNIPGVTFEEWDYWTKVSDSLSPEREIRFAEKPVEPEYAGIHWIGEFLAR